MNHTFATSYSIPCPQEVTRTQAKSWFSVLNTPQPTANTLTSISISLALCLYLQPRQIISSKFGWNIIGTKLKHSLSAHRSSSSMLLFKSVETARTHRDGESTTSTSTFTQLLSSAHRFASHWKPWWTATRVLEPVYIPTTDTYFKRLRWRAARVTCRWLCIYFFFKFRVALEGNRVLNNWRSYKVGRGFGYNYLLHILTPVRVN